MKYAMITGAWVIGWAAAVLIVAMVYAAGTSTLTVDGVVYQPTKVVGNGNTVHYVTPDAYPKVAFTERNRWQGHGSENLPCEGGIHWIDNKNVLTVSHCIPLTTTTTTVPVTTTVVPVTTTTVPVVTTTVPPTTTTLPTPTTTTIPEETTTTTTPPPTTTTIPEVVTDLPEETT